MEPSIFRKGALEKYRQKQVQSVQLRLVPLLVCVFLWILLFLILGAIALVVYLLMPNLLAK
jgi:hypothetical protein